MKKFTKPSSLFPTETEVLKEWIHETPAQYRERAVQRIQRAGDDDWKEERDADQPEAANASWSDSLNFKLDQMCWGFRVMVRGVSKLTGCVERGC